VRTKEFRRGLRFKMTLGLLVPLVVTLSVFSYAQYANQRRLLIDNLERSAANAGEIVEGGLQHAMLRNDFTDVRQIVDNMAAQQGVLDLFLLDKQGEVVLSAGNQRAGLFMPLSDLTCQACHKYEAASRNESVILTTQQGTRVFRNANSIENREACQACHDPREDTSGVLITSAGSILAILFIVNFMTSRMVISRLEWFVRAITRISQGDLGERVAVEGADEIAELAHSFNVMANGLQEKQKLEQRLEERTTALDQAELTLEDLRRLLSEGPASTLRLAHELRSPAASIYQTLDVLLQGYAGGNYESQVALLSLARDRARAMHTMVNDLLQLGAIGRAEKRKAVAPVQVADVLLRLVPAMRIKTTLKGIDFELDVADSLPPVSASEEHLAQLLSNLIDNAIKYTDPGGRVAVSLKEEGAFVIGTVEDTGIGIAPEDAKRVFEEFYRAANAKDVEPYGTGLGLSVVKRVIELYGGRLQMESDLDKGTRFTFALAKSAGADRVG